MRSNRYEKLKTNNSIQNQKPANLTKYISLKGQLHPLSESQARVHKSNVGLSTDEGMEFFIHADEKWRRRLFQCIWDHVLIKGEVDFYERVIRVKFLMLEGVDSEKYIEPLDYSISGVELTFLKNLIRNGLPVSLAG